MVKIREHLPLPIGEYVIMEITNPRNNQKIKVAGRLFGTCQHITEVDEYTNRIDTEGYELELSINSAKLEVS